MRETARRLSRSATARQSLAIGTAPLLLLVLSYVPLGVSISVSVRGIGDVSGTLSTIWRLLTGVGTFASLFLSYVSYRTEDGAGEVEFGDPSGPDTVVNVDGGDGNVTLNLTLGEGDVDSVQTEVDGTANRIRESDEP